MFLNITDHCHHRHSLTCRFRGKTKHLSVLAEQKLDLMQELLQLMFLTHLMLEDIWRQVKKTQLQTF